MNGEPHFANMSDPKIPQALAPVITGVTSLHNFMPHPMNERVNSAMSAYNVGQGYNVIAPSDLAKIYNLNPLFNAGITGKDVSVAVIEPTDVASTDDWSYFRKVLGLAGAYPSGNFALLHPGPGSAGPCNDPGVNGGEFEAMLDAEWASASAPGASVEMLSCASSDTNFGAFIALQNILSIGPVPQIVSLSYGESETQNGASRKCLYVLALSTGSFSRGLNVRRNRRLGRCRFGRQLWRQRRDVRHQRQRPGVDPHKR